MVGKLSVYRKKRHFGATPEPKGSRLKKSEQPIFVIQKHHARSLHFDLRLEMKGVLKSWAVPKGPPKKIGEKRLAVLTEDHPMEYANFSGIIPKGQYGAGKVEIWDKGHFENVKTASLEKCFQKGTLEFKAFGKRLKGMYALVHFKENNWLLMKIRTRK